jgi:hypothetical protein
MLLCDRSKSVAGPPPPSGPYLPRHLVCQPPNEMPSCFSAVAPVSLLATLCASGPATRAFLLDLTAPHRPARQTDEQLGRAYRKSPMTLSGGGGSHPPLVAVVLTVSIWK